MSAYGNIIDHEDEELLLDASGPYAITIEAHDGERARFAHGIQHYQWALLILRALEGRCPHMFKHDRGSWHPVEKTP